MNHRFEQTEVFKLDKFVKDDSTFNIFKHMLMQKKVTNSSIKNFFMMIYFLYYRISLELGICMLSTIETIIVNFFLLLILFSSINQGSRLVFEALKKLAKATSECIWIYRNLDEIKQLIKKK